MKRNLLLIILTVWCGSMTVVAQNQEGRRIKEPAKVLFHPHWFMQGQAGVAHTVGEGKFGDLLSPAAAVNIGYKFTPVWGVRVGGSGWQAKGAWASPRQNYQFKYLQANLDFMVDLSTLFCGFNSGRVFNGYLLAGAGLNAGFDNDEANRLDTQGHELEYLWQGKKVRPAGRFGLGCDFRLTERLGFNIEANANLLSDRFNSKKAGNADWQLNALVGFTVKLGKAVERTAPVYYDPEPVVPVAPKEEPVAEQQPAPQPEVKKAEPMRQDVFFALNSARIADAQRAKIDALAAYMKQHPDSKVTVTGYADRETGNPRINLTLSEKRARNVAEALKAVGIAPDRITVDFKGDTVQPHDTPKENRVSICVAE